MSLVKPTTAVRLMESLIPTPTQKPYFILDEPIPENTDKTPQDSFEQMSIMASFSTRKPVGFMQSCCFVFVGILSTYK